MWLKGRLAGKQKNRVVAKQMFGHTSEAVFYGQAYTDNEGRFVKSPAWKDEWKEGDDVTESIGARLQESAS